jgi:acetyltransferase
LLQVPEPGFYHNKPDIFNAKKIIQAALSQNNKVLSLSESKSVLQMFGIPVTSSIEVNSPDKSVLVAKKIGFPVVMKILSPDITHKQEVHGVQVNILNEEGVRSSFIKMLEEAKQINPGARIKGVTLEPMQKEANDRELMIGIFSDPLFGPVISFGAGGSNVEIMQDRAIALPPLNKFIARGLISKTRIQKLLGPFRNMPAVKFEDIERILLSVSEMVCELPEICEMDINPLIANEHGVVAVDARIVVDYPKHSEIPYGHMAIHP